MATDFIYNKLFHKHGVEFSLIEGEKEKGFRCIFEPLRYKNKIYLNGVPTEIGYDSMRKFLIMCSPEVPLRDADGTTIFLQHKGEKYKIDHCEEVYFSGKPLYFWAIIHKED